MKEIKHFMLPEHTNDLYKNEAISSISLTKEVASKINELVDAYNKLYQTNYEKIQEQDGKILKGIIYLKDNLANTISDVLDAMSYSGELKDIITDTLVNDYHEFKNSVYSIGHIARYGAIGNGVQDDTIPLMNAVKEAIANKKPLIIPDGKYLISRDIDARYIKEIDIRGEIINAGHVFTIGSSSADASGSKINIRKINNLKVVGLKNSLINVDYCEKLHLFADGDDKTASSTAYNQFYGAYCKEILIDSIGNEIGWINENVFRIKRVEKITIDGNYAHNNNHFEHINFEHGELNLLKARNNYITARCEGEITINSGDETDHNFIEKEYYHKHYFAEDVTENNKGTITHYPVNTLQVEKEIMFIDAFNKKYPSNALTFKENGKFNGKSFNSLFHSNLIKIDKTFALKFRSDAKAFRVQLRFYDENKNPIVTEVDNIGDGKMIYNGESANWTYSIGVNVDNDTLNLYPGKAKYVEYNILFGNNIESIDVEYIMAKLVKYINTDIYVTNKLNS